MIPLFCFSGDVICCTYIVLRGVHYSMLFTPGPGVAAVVFALFISSRMGKGCTTYTLSAEKTCFFFKFIPRKTIFLVNEKGGFWCCSACVSAKDVVEAF